MREKCISLYNELLSYEYLWSMDNSSLKKISELFLGNKLPSEVVKDNFGLFDSDKLEEVKVYLDKKINELKNQFSIIVNHSYQYPLKLKDAKYPINLLYYRGDINRTLDIEKNISVIGTRKVTPDGVKRTKKITKLLVKNGFNIVSGLATGVDTISLETAIANKGKVISVIGTPIDEVYPRNNIKLQELIANEHTLISQVPFYKYKVQPFNTKRIYFTERNATMSAISKASIIVEASDTSGTLVQARACIEQGRKLFILNSCFENKNIKWPTTYLKKGAIRVSTIEDILNNL